MGEVARFYGGGSDLGSVPDFGGVLPQASAFGAPAFSQLPQFPTTSEPGFGIGPDAPTTAPAAAPTPSAALGGAGPAAPAAPAVDQFGNPSNLNPYSGYGNFGPYATPSADQSFGPYAVPETAATVSSVGMPGGDQASAVYANDIAQGMSPEEARHHLETLGLGFGQGDLTTTPPPATPSSVPTGGPTTAANAFDNLPQFPTTSEPGYGVGAPATPVDTGTPNFFKRLAESIGGFKKDYGPLFELGSLGIAGGGLLKQLLQPGGTEALNPLQQEQLNMMRQQQQTAQQYMTGQVTPEMQQNIKNQTQANIQQIKAKYAQMDLSGSTAEAQEIAGAEARGIAMLGQAQSQMIQTGAQMLGLPSQTIAKLSAQQLAQDKEFSDALAAFVGSLAGTPPKTA